MQKKKLRFRLVNIYGKHIYFEGVARNKFRALPGKDCLVIKHEFDYGKSAITFIEFEGSPRLTIGEYNVEQISKDVIENDDNDIIEENFYITFNILGIPKSLIHKEGN